MAVSDQVFQTLLENLAEGVYFVDTSRKIQYWNRAAVELTGYTQEEVVGRRCMDNLLMHVDGAGEQLCLGACPLAATMADGSGRVARVYFHHRDGHRVPVRVATAAIRDDSGTIIGGIETFHDDTPMNAALDEVERLQQLSLICSLTGIGNRRYTEDTLEKRLAEAQRLGVPCAVMMFDVDHFKSVNDQYGHPVGDLVLKMVARTLKNAMRSYDFAGRWGGEEFLVIMPHIKAFELDLAANRLRLLVNSASRKISDNHLSITVSGGACLSRPGETAAACVARADQLLYTSKKNGRNRVTCVTADR